MLALSDEALAHLQLWRGKLSIQSGLRWQNYTVLHWSAGYEAMPTPQLPTVHACRRCILGKLPQNFVYACCMPFGFPRLGLPPLVRLQSLEQPSLAVGPARSPGRSCASPSMQLTSIAVKQQ